MGTARIIVAPIMTDYEQVNHAKRLSGFRDIRVVESLANLDIVLDDCLTASSSPKDRFAELNIDGLNVAANVILSDIEQHRVLELSRGRAVGPTVAVAGQGEQSTGW